MIAIYAQINGELLKRGVDPAKIVRLPNGVSLQKFRPVSGRERSALCARLSLPDDARPIVAQLRSRQMRLMCSPVRAD